MWKKKIMDMNNLITSRNSDRKIVQYTGQLFKHFTMVQELAVIPLKMYRGNN